MGTQIARNENREIPSGGGSGLVKESDHFVLPGYLNFAGLPVRDDGAHSALIPSQPFPDQINR